MQILPQQFRKYSMAAIWYDIEVSKRVLIRYPQVFPSTVAPVERHVEVQNKLVSRLNS